MSKNKKQVTGVTGLEGIFLPIIEGITEIIQEKASKCAELLSKNITDSFGVNKTPQEKRNEYLKIDTAMTFNNKQTEDERMIGYAVNYGMGFNFRYFDATKNVFIVGASGWGKTNLINLLMINSLRKNQAIVFIDPKGGKDGVSDFISICQKLGRDYYIFSESHPERTSFNPLLDLTNTERIELIMQSFDWGQTPNEYYLSYASRTLLEVLKKIAPDEENSKVNLNDVLVELKTSHNKEETSGLINQFEMILSSSFGKSFKPMDGFEMMSIKKAWQKRACVYIGCSTMGFARISRTISKMFVSSTMNLAHQIGRDLGSKEALEKPIALYIDEAGSVIFPNFLNLVNKCRSSGINIYIAVQSYSDVEMIGGNEILMKQLHDCISTWFIQKQTGENAEKLASVMGTYLSEKQTIAIEDGIDSGKRSIRDAHVYLCHPDVIKNIKVGQAILVQHSPRVHALINIRNFRKSQIFKMDSMKTKVGETQITKNKFIQNENLNEGKL